MAELAYWLREAVKHFELVYGSREFIRVILRPRDCECSAGVTYLVRGTLGQVEQERVTTFRLADVSRSERDEPAAE